MPTTRYETISSLLSHHLRHLPEWPTVLELGKTHPALAGAMLAHAWPKGGSVMINFGALLSQWWRTERRTIWVASPETAETVRDVGMAFLPGEPPPSWGGEALIVESRDRERCALVEDVFAVGIYVAKHQETEAPWYWVCCLTVSGGADTFGLPCAQGALNARLAERGELLAMPRVDDDDGSLEALGWAGSRAHTPAEQLRALRILRWLFAFSYFVDRPPAERKEPWSTVEAGQGPVERRPDGKKSLRKAGRPVALWGYRALRFAGDEWDDEPTGPPPVGGTLDTTGLERAKTIVRPHWQRVGRGEGQRVILYGAYAAHRWRRAERLGVKVGV